MPDTENTEQTEEVKPEAAQEATKEKDDLTPEQLKAALKAAREEAAGWRVKYRDAEPHVQKAKELEEASKTEAQKLAEAHKAAEERATAAEARLARLDACIKVGLDPKFLGRLQGSTPEELEADAKELAEMFGSKESGTNTPSPGRKPTARLDTARPPQGDGTESIDPAKIAERAIRDMY